MSKKPPGIETKNKKKGTPRHAPIAHASNAPITTNNFTPHSAALIKIQESPPHSAAWAQGAGPRSSRVARPPWSHTAADREGTAWFPSALAQARRTPRYPRPFPSSRPAWPQRERTPSRPFCTKISCKRRTRTSRKQNRKLPKPTKRRHGCCCCLWLRSGSAGSWPALPLLRRLWRRAPSAGTGRDYDGRKGEQRKERVCAVAMDMKGWREGKGRLSCTEHAKPRQEAGQGERWRGWRG